MPNVARPAVGLKDIFEVDGYIRERLRGNDSLGVRFLGVIALLGQELINVDRSFGDIDNPVFGDASFFVGSQFVARIVVQRGVRDFNEQVNVFGGWMSVLDPRFVKSEVRLGFVEVLDADGLIDRDAVPIFALVDEDVGKFVYDCSMFFPYWSHADDLAVEQLDSFGWGNDSSLSKFIVLGDGEFSEFGLEYVNHNRDAGLNLGALALRGKS